MLIDEGNPSDGYYITEFLKAQGIKRIDYLIGTHIDDDHIGGMYKIIEQMHIGTVYVPDNKYSKNSYDSMKSELEKRIEAMIRVIKPLTLRNEIKEIIEKANKEYN